MFIWIRISTPILLLHWYILSYCYNIIINNFVSKPTKFRCCMVAVVSCRDCCTCWIMCVPSIWKIDDFHYSTFFVFTYNDNKRNIVHVGTTNSFTIFTTSNTDQTQIYYNLSWRILCLSYQNLLKISFKLKLSVL